MKYIIHKSFPGLLSHVATNCSCVSCITDYLSINTDDKFIGSLRKESYPYALSLRALS